MATAAAPAPRAAPTPTAAPARTAPPASAPRAVSPPPGAPAPASTTAPASAPPPPRSTPPAAVTAPPRGTTVVSATKPTGKVSKLGEITSGVLLEPERCVFFGTRGVGKSTLAADIPNAVFLDLDLGSGKLPVNRYPLDIDATYQDVLDAIDDLTLNPHAYKALVIDEASKLESLIWAYCVERAPAVKGEKPTSIEEIGGGFQKGYRVAEQEWRILLSKLDRLRLRRGMHTIVLSHTHVAKVKNPEGEDYGKHAPMIHEYAVGALCGNADTVGFVTFADIAKRISKTKIIGASGRRVVHLEHTASIEAKTRLPLPPMIDLPEASPWQPFADAIEAFRSMTPAALRTSINGELARLGENFVRENGTAGTAQLIKTAVARAGDNVADLHRYLTILQQSNPVTDDSTEEQPQ